MGFGKKFVDLGKNFNDLGKNLAENDEIKGVGKKYHQIHSTTPFLTQHILKFQNLKIKYYNKIKATTHNDKKTIHLYLFLFNACFIKEMNKIIITQ